MKVICVEDEMATANRIVRLVEDILGERLTFIKHFCDLDDAEEYLMEKSVDVVLLDLNLHGQDGFELLERCVCQSFQTIVISAYSEKALQAFEYGVLDFVAKPFARDRLAKALQRLSDDERVGQARYLTVKHQGRLQRVAIDEVEYIRGASNYSELCLTGGQTLLHDKSLNQLEKLLPEVFTRVHKSYLARLSLAESLVSRPGPNYFLVYRNQTEVPVGRTKIAKVRELFGV